MKLTFLGTSAGTPSRTRNVTAQAVTFDDGRIWLLDCGEGTQHRLLTSPLRASRIERILVTHLHGDHCYGLPGLLSFLAINGREEPVEIIGPEGVREFVETALRVSYNQLGYALTIVEHAGGDLGVRGGWSVSAAALVHRVPSFGYVLREPPRPGRFHRDRAEALAVPLGPLWGRLQSGQAVVLPDGRTVRSDEVRDPDRPGRHLVLLGDTSDSAAIEAMAMGCDLLVHEATYDAARADKAVEWGHSTSVMAGRFAARCRAKTLALTHFSARFHEPGEALSIDDLVREAAAECPETRVLAADDHLDVEIK
ncbi:MAG: ribonuclease Z [Planctomycetes bacterium]|nr:ribonuclease Z [Planctomycetota bacterium]